MSDKPFDAEACDIGGQASATNGLSDMKTHIENAQCNRPLIDVFAILQKAMIKRDWHDDFLNCNAF
jgi:hypothetical protein